MNQISQAPVRTRTIGMIILTLLLAAQGLMGVAAIIQSYVSASNSGVSFSTVYSALSGGFDIIVVSTVIPLVLALVYLLVQRWTFWLILLAELTALLLGVVAITIHDLDWYTTPVWVVLPVLILVYMFADRQVRASRRRRAAPGR
jgi:hypothetical protein